MGARGKQAQLAQANGSKFNLLLMLVARRMSTYPSLGRARRRSLHPGVFVEAGGNVRVVVGFGHVGPEQERVDLRERAELLCCGV